MDTYDITAIEALENSASNLARYNQEISNAVGSLNYIMTSVKNNWQNEQGSDLQSILTELQDCIDQLQNVISPTLANFTSTLNTIAADSRSHQGNTIDF